MFLAFFKQCQTMADLIFDQGRIGDSQDRCVVVLTESDAWRAWCSQLLGHTRCARWPQLLGDSASRLPCLRSVHGADAIDDGDGDGDDDSDWGDASYNDVEAAVAAAALAAGVAAAASRGGQRWRAAAFVAMTCSASSVARLVRSMCSVAPSCSVPRLPRCHSVA